MAPCAGRTPALMPCAKSLVDDQELYVICRDSVSAAGAATAGWTIRAVSAARARHRRAGLSMVDSGADRGHRHSDHRTRFQAVMSISGAQCGVDRKILATIDQRAAH